MRTRQKCEVSILILPSSCHPPMFMRCSCFLPNLVLLMGSQHSCSDPAESLLHPELEPDVPPPYTFILCPLPFHLGFASLPKIVPRFSRMTEKKSIIWLYVHLEPQVLSFDLISGWSLFGHRDPLTRARDKRSIGKLKLFYDLPKGVLTVLHITGTHWKKHRPLSTFDKVWVTQLIWDHC